MKGDKESTDRVEIGSVVQINPGSETPGASLLAVVDVKESWGVLASFWDGALWTQVRLAWLHVEPTGGKIIWDRAGKQVQETVEPMRHHP